MTPGKPSPHTESSLSLRSQLLLGLGLLLLVALLGMALTLLVWIPADLSVWVKAGGLFLLAAVEVAVLVLFADFLLRRLFVAPLQEMVEDAARIADGDHGHRLDTRGPAELRRLAVSVNEMAERLIRQKQELEENIRSLDETNRALTEARDELIHAEKLASVGRLAAGLAHEIGNPLNAITTYVEIGRRRVGDDEEWLEGVAGEAKRIDRIVGGLLDYARPRDGPTVHVRVNEVVRETLELLDGQGRLDGVEVRTHLAGDLPGVRANPFHLQQVLVNLMLNACDAIEESGAGGRVDVVSREEEWGGPEGARYRPRRRDDPVEVDYSHIRRFNAPPRAVRRATFDEGQPLVVLEVKDDGPGLPTQDPEQVFDPFFTTKDPGKGTGLGLAVSARLVEQMEGSVEAADREEGGCVFRVRLPVAARDGGAGGEGGADEEAREVTGDGRDERTA